VPNPIQPFSSVVVTVNEIIDDELKMQIEHEMVEYDQARIAHARASNDVITASAALLAAQGARAIAKIKLVSTFAIGSDKVAMEPNWEPFRAEGGRPAVENFMSERDQRNFHRFQRAQMNAQAGEVKGGGFDGMFERPDTDQ
jgi:hypothetical protein